VIPDGSLLLRNGLIEALGPTRRIENLKIARDAETINARGQVIMPAFTDAVYNVLPVGAISHLQQGGNRPRDLTAYPPLRFEQRETSRAVLGRTPTVIRSQIRSRLAKFARLGNTQTLFAIPVDLSSDAGLKMLRNLAGIGEDGYSYQSALLLLSSLQDSAAMSFDEIRSLLSSGMSSTWKFLRENLVLFVPIDTAPLNNDNIFQLLAFVQSTRLRVQFMTNEPDIALCREWAREMDAPVFMGPLKDEPGFLRLLRWSNAVWRIPFSRYIEIARASPRFLRKALDENCAIAISSGYDENWYSTANLPLIWSLFCRELGLSIEEAISCSVYNNAASVGLDGMLGSLEAGKRADLVFLECEDYRELAAHYGTNPVAGVMWKGSMLPLSS
jgi:imidazolonepropionase